MRLGIAENACCVESIRTMAYLTLGYDHRLIDGAAADQFMSDVKKNIEQFDQNQV